MRPVRLEVEGFTSFQRRVEIDFSELDLFAITGATGAGKTSLLDAMLYAFYGRTPRLDSTSASELISLGSRGMAVLLEFTTTDQRYRVVRNVKLGKKGATTSTVRLERHNGQDWEPLAGGVRELNAKVQEILGLDFDGFTRSVVLP